MANIANFNPSKVTTGRLKPELQAIFDELPVLIDYCERNGQILSEQIIEEIKDEINLTPERREQVIITHRDKFAERYKELIISGLRLKATDKDDILETIGLLMYVKGTWELPMPKDCGFGSIKPDPKGYFHAMIAPVFNNYAFIQACNDLLNQQAPTTDTPKPPQPPKTFPEYILHPDRENIAEALKTTFRGEKGKSIRLMIEVLKDHGLITYENRQRQKIFDAMKLYFDWYIGRRQSIFDYKRINDIEDYKAIEVRMLPILESIKNNK